MSREFQLADMFRRLLTVVVALVALVVTAGPAPAAVTVGHSGWEWGNPSPQGQTLRAIEFAGGVGYAAGDFGTLLRTLDGGATWSGAATGTTQELTRISIADADVVVIAGGCAVRRSADGGQSFRRLPWTASDARCTAEVVALDYPTADTGYLVLEDGSVLRTGDGGTSWSRRSSLPVAGVDKPTDVTFIDQDTGVAVTSAGTIYRTIDGGSSWTLAHQDIEGLYSLYFVTSLHGYAAGGHGKVLRTMDGGSTWVQVTAGGDRILTIRCATVLRCLLAKESGDLLRTVNGGFSFEAVDPATAKVFGAAFSSQDRAVAVGDGGITVVSDDAGATWSPVGARLTAKFSRVRAVTSRLAFAVGPDGTLARSDDGGQTWSALGASTVADVIDVSFADEHTGYALDAEGTLMRTDDGGQSWRVLDTGTASRPQALLALGTQVVLLIGPRGAWRSTDGGASFVRVRGRLLNRSKLFNVDRGGNSVFVYGSKNILASTTRGRTWRKVRLPRKTLIQAVDFVSARRGFALGQDGQVFKTKNRGDRWLDLSGVGSDHATGLSFSTASVGFLTLKRFGSRPWGYVLRTTDGGRTWGPQLVGTEEPSPDGLVATGYKAAFLLADSRALLFTNTGGERGDASKVTLRTSRRTVRRRAVIRITGRVSGARAGASVVVSRRERGERGWVSLTATVRSNGTFSTNWKLVKTAAFVAQWEGDENSAGDGSVPLVVRTKRRR